jgi:hypothetical protein
MWIEDEIQKDVAGLQKTMQDLRRDYTAQLPRSIRSHIPEKKELTTDFFNAFYDKLRTAEYELYQIFTKDVNKPKDPVQCETCETKLAYHITEIKNSANDLPHPRILSGLQRTYDMRRNHNSGGDDDQYIPYKVYSYIREKSEFCIHFKTVIHGRQVSLHFITFPESHISVCSKHNNWSATGASSYLCASEIAMYQVYAYKVFIWLSIVTSLSDRECSEKSLNVYFYMTPFKKQRPSQGATGEDAVLSAIHVNTGLTRNCERDGEIVVYRTEEWFKVFVHESMHNFNMDFIDQDIHAANERLRNTFCIPHEDILLFETYTETWARIINTMFVSYFEKSPSSSMTQVHFVRTVREKLIQNAIFYVYQAVKVLDIMKLRYYHITIQSPENMEVCRKRYIEDTNVYAYYILGGILSAYALPFISWCCQHNQGKGRVGAIRFARNTGTLPKFVDLLAAISRDPVVLSMVAYIENPKMNIQSFHGSTALAKKTMRMTID